MLFNNIKKYLVVFPTLLLVCGNASFASESSEINNNKTHVRKSESVSHRNNRINDYRIKYNLDKSFEYIGKDLNDIKTSVIAVENDIVNKNNSLSVNTLQRNNMISDNEDDDFAHLGEKYDESEEGDETFIDPNLKNYFANNKK